MLRVLWPFLLALSLVLPLSVWASEDADQMKELIRLVEEYKGANYAGAHLLILKKMVHVDIPQECWPRMHENESNDGGVRAMVYFTADAIEYFERAGYKGLPDMAYRG